MSRWAPFALSLTAILLLIVLLMNPRQPPLVGDPAPELALPDFAAPSTLVRQADLLGQPYLLSVWSSWCLTCRHQHPVIIDIARSGRVRVIGFNYRDSHGNAAQWLQQFGNPYHRILVDVGGRVAIDWGITATPANILVDASGVVRWKQLGPMTREIAEKDFWPLLAEIEAGR